MLGNKVELCVHGCHPWAHVSQSSPVYPRAHCEQRSPVMRLSCHPSTHVSQSSPRNRGAQTSQVALAHPGSQAHLPSPKTPSLQTPCAPHWHGAHWGPNSFSRQSHGVNKNGCFQVEYVPMMANSAAAKSTSPEENRRARVHRGLLERTWSTWALTMKTIHIHATEAPAPIHIMPKIHPGGVLGGL